MKHYAVKVLITIGIIIGILLIPVVFYYVFPHFIPFIFAYLFALMLEPINLWLMKMTKLKRSIAVNITYFLFLGTFSWLVYMIVTRISIEMVNLIQYIQKNIPNIQLWFFHIYRQTQDVIQMLPTEVSTQINQSFTQFINDLANMDLLSTIGTQTYNITTAIPNYFITLILFFVSLFLISLNLPYINRKFFSYFKKESKAKLEIILKDIRVATFGFLHAQVILSSITYIISLIGLVLLNVGYASAIALLIVVVDILPILGTGSVLMPWAIFSITKGNTLLGIGLIVLFIVITVVRRVIEPKILGERIGLDPLTTLISIWVGFKVLGILGVFLGPLLLILYKALVKAKVIRYRLKI
ncbi:MAG: sporulation integral membrane protein YtvI [Tepidibacillus sp.]